MKRIQALTVPEGDGVTVKRLMPVMSLHNYDPFVLCDYFDIAAGGFPNHPHRGFEAITYMIEGGMQHKDNLGNASTVTAGGIQRFTAGRGIVHSEMPQGRAHGIQLWINLPKRLKSMQPSYQQVDAADLPVTDEAGVHVRTIVGDGSPTELQTPVLYLDVTIDEGSDFKRDVPSGMQGFVFLLSGAMSFIGENMESADAMLLRDESSLDITATQKSKFIVCLGVPHGEPIYQHGPYVD